MESDLTHEENAEVSSPIAASVSVPVKQETYITLIIRPQEKWKNKPGFWIMGDDWIIERPDLSNIIELREFIEKEKGISRHRQQLRIKDKLIVPSKEVWNLRRIGLFDNSVICLEPTLSGAWLWNSIEFYNEQLILTIQKAIELSEKKRILLQNIESQIDIPPPIKCSLRVFIRKYPDRIHMYTNTETNEIWLDLVKGWITYNKHLQNNNSKNKNKNNIIKDDHRKHSKLNENQFCYYHLPTFNSMPMDVGIENNFYKHNPSFNWDDYEDIDDMKQLILMEEEEEEETKNDDIDSNDGSDDDDVEEDSIDKDESMLSTTENGNSDALLDEEGNIIQNPIIKKKKKKKKPYVGEVDTNNDNDNKDVVDIIPVEGESFGDWEIGLTHHPQATTAIELIEKK
eukprot:gene7279-9921_t